MLWYDLGVNLLNKIGNLGQSATHAGNRQLRTNMRIARTDSLVRSQRSAVSNPQAESARNNNFQTTNYIYIVFGVISCINGDV